MSSPDTTYADNQDDEALELAALSHISSARAFDVVTMRKWAAEVVRLRAQTARFREALKGLVTGPAGQAEDYRFEDEGAYICVYCNRGGEGRDLHHDGCPILVARAALAEEA